MSDPTWKLVSSETIFETSSKGLRVQKRMYECEDGRKKTVELKDEGPFGHAFAMTPDKKVILIRQFRPGPDRYFYESPAGSLDKSDDWKAEVERELQEETGYTSKNVSLLREGYDGAYTTAKRYMYLAQDCIKSHDQRLEDEEYIDHIHLATIDELKELIKQGEYTYPLLAYLAFEKLGL
jgi:ADP-ribose pyrophosphatase